jgi:hypothetical protein
MSASDFSHAGGAASPSPDSPSLREEKQDKIVKCPWTKEDDLRVAELVSQYGTKSWSALAAHLPGRTGKQIRERWHNQVQLPQHVRGGGGEAAADNASSSTPSS